MLRKIVNVYFILCKSGGRLLCSSLPRMTNNSSFVIFCRHSRHFLLARGRSDTHGLLVAKIGVLVECQVCDAASVSNVSWQVSAMCHGKCQQCVMTSGSSKRSHTGMSLNPLRPTLTDITCDLRRRYSMHL